MKIEVHPDAHAAACAAARIVAAEARACVAARGHFVLALSGGRTPWFMLRALVGEDVPWKALHLVQVDERAAPVGHADRNLTHVCEILRRAPIRADQIVAMPVDAPDLAGAARRYHETLETVVGAPPVIDLVHLGLGADGDTASLVPGDPACDVTDADVAATGVYQGLRRTTLTFPILNRARSILWLVTGSDKSAMLGRLRDGDRSIPAGRVTQDHALVVADRMAAGEPGPRY